MNGLKLNSGIYSTKELEKILGNRPKIRKLIKNGEIYQFDRGYYAASNVAYDSAFYLLALKLYPQAVLSAQSGLYYHGLSKFQPDKIHLDSSQNGPYRRPNKTFEHHRVLDSRLHYIESIDLSGIRLRIYTLERTLFEMLKIERTLGVKTIEACKRYLELRNYKPNLSLLDEISKSFGRRGGQMVDIIAGFRFDLYNL